MYSCANDVISVRPLPARRPPWPHMSVPDEPNVMSPSPVTVPRRFSSPRTFDAAETFRVPYTLSHSKQLMLCTDAVENMRTTTSELPATLSVTSSAGPGTWLLDQLLASFQLLLSPPPSHATAAKRRRGSSTSLRNIARLRRERLREVLRDTSFSDRMGSPSRMSRAASAWVPDRRFVRP